MAKTFCYLTKCVNCKDVDALLEMIDQSRPVTWRTFQSHVPIEEIERLFPSTAPHIKDDWSVSFYRSRFKGQRCYYIDHSAIEYIFVENR